MWCSRKSKLGNCRRILNSDLYLNVHTLGVSRVADRRPHSGLLEYKQAIKPFNIESYNIETGMLKIRNMRTFTDLSDFDLIWNFEKNGKVIREGRIAPIKINPLSTKSFKIGSVPANVDTCLNVSLRYNTKKPWANVGYEAGFHQIELSTISASEIKIPYRRAIGIPEINLSKFQQR